MLFDEINVYEARTSYILDLLMEIKKVYKM